MAVFDERVPSTAAYGGRVHCSRDHSAWVVSAHLRSNGVPEVSYEGVVVRVVEIEVVKRGGGGV